MTSTNYAYGSGTDLIRIKNASGANDPRKKADNAYSCDITYVSRSKSNKYEVMYGNVWWYPPGNSVYYIGGDLSYMGPTANQELALLGKLTEQMRGHSFNALVFAGELPQTLALVVNTSRAVFGALRSTLRGDLFGAAKHLGFVPGQRQARRFRRRVEAGDISGAWLSLKYGWEPLLSDIYEMMRAVEARNRNRFTVFRASRRETSVHNASVDAATYPVWSRDSCTLSYKVTLSEQLSVARTLGLTNPASLVWEKLPWSFVIDWFIPIGSYLDSLGFFSGASTRVCRTAFSKSVARYTGPENIRISPTSMWKGGSFYSERVVLSRTIGSIVVPKPDFKQLNKAFSLGHIQNAAALIHQLIAGGRRDPRYSSAF